MSFFKNLRRKKKEEEKVVTGEVKKTELEEICAGDRETYEALKEVMLLDPRKIGISLEEAAKKAKEAEKAGNKLQARLWYELAGKLAIWKGDVKRVREFFSQCQKILPNVNYPVLKNPEKAVAKAKEYYEKYLKEEKKEEKK
jgi:hypothetical protein